MSSLRFFLISLLTLVVTDLISDPAFSQSTIVRVNTQRLHIPNSLSPATRRAEQKLKRATPASWRSTMTLKNLIQALNQTGLSIGVAPLAEENGLSPQTPIRMALRNASLGENLRFALRGHNCDFTINASGIIIIDDESHLAEDRTNFLVVTYNLNQVVKDLSSADDLKSLLEQSINMEDWENYGGPGQMLISTGEKGYLLTVSQTWRHQQQILHFLETHVVLGGRLKTTANELASRGISRPVKLPENYRSLRRNRKGISLPGSESTSGFGGGGAIRGGGVF